MKRFTKSEVRKYDCGIAHISESIVEGGHDPFWWRWTDEAKEIIGEYIKQTLTEQARENDKIISREHDEGFREGRSSVAREIKEKCEEMKKDKNLYWDDKIARQTLSDLADYITNTYL